LRTSSLLQLPLSPPPPSLRSSPPAPTLGRGGGAAATGTAPRTTAIAASVAAATAAAGSSSSAPAVGSSTSLVPRQLHRWLVPGHRFTTYGLAPSTCGPAHVLHWRRFPSLVLSNRPSSPSSSHLLLHRLRGSASGLHLGSTIPWPACPPGTPSRWPLHLAWRRYSSPRPMSGTSTQVLLPT
jgi:hypothetical protein